MDNAKVAKVVKPVVAVVGMQNRLMCKVPGVGKQMVAMTSKSLGKLLPKLSFLGFRNQPSYENALWNWELFLELLGADYEKEELGAEGNRYTFHKCPAGYTCAAHLDACEATMELDNNLTKSSGAKLIVEKCIPNDGVCVETLAPAD